MRRSVMHLVYSLASCFAMVSSPAFSVSSVYSNTVAKPNLYAFHLRPRGSNGTVAVRLIVVVWPVCSMHRAAVLVLLAGETSLSGSP